MKNLFILLLASLTLLSNAQNRCGTEAHTLELIEKYPEYAIAKAKVNYQTEKWIQNHPTNSQKTIITIPVVVHVVWNTNSENISDAQIFSQIEVLNNDFRRTNVDVINTPSVWQGIAADSEIEFCLAQTDQNGIATTGIDRVQTTQTSFGMSGDPVMSVASEGADPWDQDYYLNIWVCDLGSGLLGYASQPSSWPNPSDGVVIGYKYFGNTGTAQSPYHKGRTATHEIGHWLNLEHLWGWGSCGNDQVSDTPKQETENYSCPGFPAISSCDDPLTTPIEDNAPNGDMFMNYMDYTNDACMNLFTAGQKTRMISAINQYRSNLIYNTCSNPTTNIIDISITNKKLVKIVDVLGRTISDKTTNTPLFYIYNNGTVEKKIIIE
ncbi:MAG TPA: zinc metalloprotease [Flavobacteriales bacterium]|nr:zinc metalloprotease [Flavobacteriales bacterium]HIK63355.1 zinc metalloprotease [Flavobacteriales bacterium]